MTANGTARRTAALPPGAALLAAALLAAALLAAVLPAPASSGTAAGSGAAPSGGISAEEYARVFPPAPVDVRAAFAGGVVTLRWTPPAPAAPSGAFDPAVGHYRVFRLGDGGAATLIGETRDTVFHDRAAPAGTVQRYAVTAVQRSGQESGLSAEAVLRVP